MRVTMMLRETVLLLELPSKTVTSTRLSWSKGSSASFVYASCCRTAAYSARCASPRTEKVPAEVLYDALTPAGKTLGSAR